MRINRMSTDSGLARPLDVNSSPVLATGDMARSREDCLLVRHRQPRVGSRTVRFVSG